MVDIYMIDFIIISVLTVASAILTLEMKEIMYGIFFFDLFTIGIAGIFLLLNAGFLSMFELIVYAGAIVVVVIFAVMLSRRVKTGEEVISHASLKAKIASIALAVVVITLMIIMISSFHWTTAIGYANSNGGVIFTTMIEHFDLAFLGISILIAISLIGGVALLRKENVVSEEKVSE